MSKEQDFERLLTGVVTHDLLNPLAAITACVNALNRLGPLDDQRERCLHVIASSSARLKRLFTDLADLVLAVGSGIPLRLAQTHIDAICGPVVRGLQAVHPGREVRCEGGGDGLGYWDAVRLAQALTNLVSNALRYSEPSSPVEVRWDGRDAARVTIEVISQGPALSAETLAALFSPFREGRRPSSNREGLGVGIFIADHLARGHGGSLQASAVDSRTVFRLELPRQALPRQAGCVTSNVGCSTE